MAKIKITNGFPNINGPGELLTGLLIEGIVNQLDFIVVSEETKVQIVEVELGDLYQGTSMIRITVPRGSGIVFREFFGKTFVVKNAR